WTHGIVLGLNILFDIYSRSGNYIQLAKVATECLYHPKLKNSKDSKALCLSTLNFCGKDDLIIDYINQCSRQDLYFTHYFFYGTALYKTGRIYEAAVEFKA
ncbi:MAG: hypothetical protein M3R00_04985, partial [Pseudomonadota bacterium]|nr:hypothetical protein [Pseudomonadota bacterium]